VSEKATFDGLRAVPAPQINPTKDVSGRADLSPREKVFERVKPKENVTER
jgi:hypothetical protein